MGPGRGAAAGERAGPFASLPGCPGSSPWPKGLGASSRSSSSSGAPSPTRGAVQRQAPERAARGIGLSSQLLFPARAPPREVSGKKGDGRPPKPGPPWTGSGREAAPARPPSFFPLSVLGSRGRAEAPTEAAWRRPAGRPRRQGPAARRSSCGSGRASGSPRRACCRWPSCWGWRWEAARPPCSGSAPSALACSDAAASRYSAWAPRGRSSRSLTLFHVAGPDIAFPRPGFAAQAGAAGKRVDDGAPRTDW